MSGKRGQFYLVAAIIIILILYSLSTRVNVIREQPRFTDFNRIADNYLSEVTKIVNYGIYTKIADIQASLIAPFTANFIAYARTRDPNIGLVYVYGDNSKTVIENHLPGDTIVYYNSSDPDTDPLSGQIFTSDSESINEVGVTIGGEDFKHVVPVKLGSFSSNYYSSTLASIDNLRIDVLGVPYLYDSGSTDNSFNVVFRTENEEFGTSNVETCQYSGSGAWTSC